MVWDGTHINFILHQQVHMQMLKRLRGEIEKFVFEKFIAISIFKPFSQVTKSSINLSISQQAI